MVGRRRRRRRRRGSSALVIGLIRRRRSWPAHKHGRARRRPTTMIDPSRMSDLSSFSRGRAPPKRPGSRRRLRERRPARRRYPFPYCTRTRLHDSDHHRRLSGGGRGGAVEAVAAAGATTKPARVCRHGRQLLCIQSTPFDATGGRRRRRADIGMNSARLARLHSRTHPLGDACTPRS
jgi:hypothetical protein